METSVAPDMYEKSRSIVGLRCSSPAAAVRRRIDHVRNRPDLLPPDPRVRSVLERAFGELAGELLPEAGHPPFSLQPFVIDEMQRMSDEQVPRYLYYRYRYEVFPHRCVLDDFPPLLQVEPTSICNYRCVFCYQTDSNFTRRHHGHMGRMTLELFTRIVDEATGKCEALTLASRGEPLLCPDIGSMLSYAAGKFLALKLNTNGWMLDERICHAILESDMNTLVVSVDAVSDADYSRLRVNGKLERIKENVRRFRAVRERHYPGSRTILRVSGVKVPGTPTLGVMERFWGEWADQVAFVRYHPWENVYERPENGILTPCSDLWRRMFLWWDGGVNPCDIDYKSTLTVGRFPDRGLEFLWKSGPYARLRESHALNGRATASPCNRCMLV